MKDCCNNCNFQGGIKPVLDTIKILCLYADEWHRENYNCGYWKLYDPALSKYERLKLAKYIYKDKYIEYEKYLQRTMNSGLISVLSSIAIFFLIFIVIIGAYIIPSILQ